MRNLRTDQMSDADIALLPDRGIVSVAGMDARRLLQGIITNDMDLLDAQPAIFAGLLSPQGKVLFEFFVVKADDGFLLDVASEKAGELAKRLAMYKLRAKATIEHTNERYRICAAWGAEPPRLDATVVFADPRSAALGWRAVFDGTTIAPACTADTYDAHRIGLAIPEGGKDYDFGDAFPHEANFDLLHGVGFEKGCYVGQEIVSRMQHRATVRKRIVRVTGEADLPASRPVIKTSDVVIGQLGSVAGKQGLAMLRLDRAIEAIDKGEAITADGISLNVDADMLARQRVMMAKKAANP